jgi:hypothetical protein
MFRSNKSLVPTQGASVPEEAMRAELMELEANLAQHEKQVATTAKFILRAKEHIETLQDILTWSVSRQMAACITKRNEISTSELRKDYESISAPSKDLNRSMFQVFCISSNAHILWRTSPDPIQGYPKRSDTGIARLRKWLIKTTLASRNDNALAFLERLEDFRVSFEPWLSDNSLDFKLVRHQRKY